MVAGNSDRVVTVGVNWYLNRWVKVQFNVMHDTLRDPSQDRVPASRASGAACCDSSCQFDGPVSLFGKVFAVTLRSCPRRLRRAGLAFGRSRRHDETTTTTL